MKKFFAVLLTLAFLFSLCACGDTEATSSVSDDSIDVTSDVIPSGDSSSEDTSSEYVEDPSNVALYKRTYRSSESAVMPSTYLTDGDDSAWSSDTTSESIDEWVVVDLGKNYELETISILWGISYSPEFSVEISRGGVEYTEIYSVNDSTGGISTIQADGKTARYIRRTSRI